MTTNILLTLLASLLTLSGVHTSSMNDENVNTNISTNVSSEAVTQSNESQNYDTTDESSDENYEDDSMTLEEKYEHNQNKEDYLEDDGENVIWYDVPYCDNHDYEVIDSDTETLYICKKCGYSEFYEKNTETNNDTTDTESDECNDEDSSEDETENTSNEE